MDFGFKDLEFFIFLVYMSVVSFAVAFLAYGIVVRSFGKDGFLSRCSQVVLVPGSVIAYDLVIMAYPDYHYVIGSVPLALIAIILFYVRFIRGEELGKDSAAPAEQAKLAREEKKFSKKSQRIHAARKSRGRD